MKRKVSLVAAVSLMFFVMTVKAEVVSVDDARNVASQFVSAQSAQGLRGMDVRADETLAAPIMLAQDGDVALYVFNRSMGGYVIVSAESDTQRQILAWSDEGQYDPANVPEGMKAVLDNYISGINRLRKASPAERALMERAQQDAKAEAAARRRVGDLPASVDPLLGPIEWNQGDPYSRMTPPIYIDGYTYHYVTGCVATAVAQVMMYHRWPERGRGSNSYQWKGTTLSADFSQSIYRWDLMLPKYETDWYTMTPNYTDEQADAVALLMHDVGYALSMNYETDGSGSSVNPMVLINNFDYDRDMRTLYGNYCSTEDWENELRQELAAGRPVLTGGGNSDRGAHELVCDGYDADGLFHYNYGWGGNSNGWYASTATSFDSSPGIVYGIEKNHGGTGKLSLESRDDFRWSEDNILRGALSATCAGMADSQSITIDGALALKNVATGEVTYYITTTAQSYNIWMTYFQFDQEVPDGTYEVTPVARMNGDEWQTFFHHPLRQIVIDLTVSGGIKTWANNRMFDPIDEGTVEVDGFYYTLDEEKGEATVTCRNNRKNSYSGDIIIPDEISYQGHTYSVTAIGESAFGDCDKLGTVTVGRRVRSILAGAFDFSSLSAIHFAEGGDLTFLDGWAFNACSHLAECVLPEGLLKVGKAVVQSCTGLRRLVIPSTVTEIPADAFNGISNAELVQVRWTSLSNKVNCHEFAFRTVDLSRIDLLVPEGCADVYRAAWPWNAFNIKEDHGYTTVESSYDSATATHTISGDGYWLWNKYTVPWLTYQDDIRHLVMKDGVDNVPYACFSDSQLETVELGEGITSIGYDAFRSCSDINSVSLPGTLTSIGGMAFYIDLALTSITFPASLEFIDDEAFSYCTHLSTIRSHALTPPQLGREVFTGISQNGTLIVPTGSDYSSWLSQLPPHWELVVTDDVDGERAREWGWTFDDASGTLTIEGAGPMSYVARTDWADFTENIRRVVIGEGITTVPQLCFWICGNMQSVSLPSTMRYLDYGAFYDCHSLTQIECQATTAPDVSAGDVFAYLPDEGTLTVPDGADYSTWLAILPAGWTIASGTGGDDDDPLVGTELYVLGCDGNWNPAQPSATLPYREADKVYAGDITVADAGGSFGYFCIGTTLGTDNSDWETFNAHRLGAPYGNYLLMSGSFCRYVVGQDASFMAPAGTHHLTVDIKLSILSFDSADNIRPLESNPADTPQHDHHDHHDLYDLFGRPVHQPTQGGLYIQNGQKILIR